MREFKEHDFGPAKIDRSENRERYPLILFQKEFIKPILRDQKSETRRLWLTRRCKPNRRYWAQTSLNPLSRFALLHVVSVKEWDGITMSDADVRMEGFNTHQEFWAKWDELNVERLKDPRRTPYVIQFRVRRTFRLKYYDPDLPKGAMQLA